MVRSEKSTTPEPIARLTGSIEKWLKKEGYSIPVEWDETLDLLFVGDRKGRTWTRLSRAQVESPDGPSWGLTFAQGVVADWHRIWSTPSTFQHLPKQNQKDLQSYFGERRGEAA